MSGTRLLSLREPATETAVKPALLVVAHGERGGDGNDRLVHAAAARLRRCENYRSVKTCFLSKEPSLRSVFHELSPGPVTIYPLFMSDGYFVKQAIPGAINLSESPEDCRKRDVSVLTPLGLSLQLPQLVADAARRAARASGRAAGDCRLLLVAHGSKHDRASHDSTHALAQALESLNEFAGIALGFLEESPFLDEQLRKIAGPVVAVGLFIGEGMHGAGDLPTAVEMSGRDDIVLSPPLVRWPGLIDLICADMIEPSALSH